MDTPSSDPLTTLRSRYPWPSEYPTIEPHLYDDRPHGWCCGQNIAMFNDRLSESSRLVVEIGAWLGRSTTYLLDAAPQATVISIDHWEGSAEHHANPEWAKLLPGLYERFLRHLWSYRARLVPMRTSSLRGMAQLHGLGLMPDLIYIDGWHDAPSVCADVAIALELFPASLICGDDWTFDSVREGVRMAVGISDADQEIIHHTTCWEILRDGCPAAV